MPWSELLAAAYGNSPDWSRHPPKPLYLPQPPVQMVPTREILAHETTSPSFGKHDLRCGVDGCARPKCRTDPVLSLDYSGAHDPLAVPSSAGRTMPFALPIPLLLIGHSQQTTAAVRAEFKAALDAPVKSASVRGSILFPAGQKRVGSVIVTVARPRVLLLNTRMHAGVGWPNVSTLHSCF